MSSGLWIDGGWQESRGDRGEFAVVDPATTGVLARVVDGSVEDMAAAVDAASRTHETWAETPARERSVVLRRAWELMTERSEELARLIVLENGKALPDARSEVVYAAEFFRWFSEEAVRAHGDMRRSPSGQNWIMVTEEPIGVALLVTPWNYPAAMATRKIAPALAAGCTAVLKPAAETPLTALALAELLADAGLPDGVLNVVCTTRAGQLVEHALGDPRVRALSFTGSTEVGRKLLALAARNVVRASMELGGNAPFVVLDDADLEEAVEGLMVAKLRNGGSACTAANRIYVADRVADEFVERFTARMAGVRHGNGLDEGVELGPLVNEDTQRKVGELVDGALREGASLATGGGHDGLPGYSYRATVLTDVKPDAEILKHEIFGPVAPIVRFGEDAEAVALANDSEFGLISYLYTRDLDRGLAVSRRLRSGMVGVNRGVVSDPAAPFGGVKQSGIGREGAAEGLREFTEMKYTAIPYR
ncbi:MULTISPECIES: NAD-dependent succinate-semialdehyde dehydrogenase [unclassified Nocardioides]|uniref:NAD-dependent succinate-semialdehyde dehydrogenase n=1 Tax=unclassified Nocardioides TaxID=2615069 RepID=UPI000056FB5E|nr:MULTISPECIES: NAD-dependent succinate-semialdehyde dehydrogenase [unclassified Nocardioides]ABL80217.1 succinate semialdehyde dehydrogenase [Nocardioides sp. JS614]